MPFDAIVRASFESRTEANQAVNRALVGHATGATGPGPFKGVGTAAYSCSCAEEVAVGEAIEKLGIALRDHASVLDFVSIALVRRR